ncbi:uncharacterized protein LY89DRAFT_736008 [Mollisia scopiformis]|uniref:SRR1-like domain-containing protein n=1 Tax=Mollisia scopiformis TaxID=149040 RepID=A0A194X438_MOLSC|nr:uncharacterized protein LY89DRAFT_736008 [Mollisia scopiformis]KUJ14950.1 hypothetical protein LY89DRAFT_736008 [Mollisia scopiformis]
MGFLNTGIPNDTAPDPLNNANVPELEKSLLRWKQEWLATQYPVELQKVVRRIIDDRDAQPISNAVCLGISGQQGTQDRDLLQFVVFSQIVAQLANANPILLSNIVVQDPQMTPDMRALFLNHGCQIMESPAAFAEVEPNTFLFSPFVEPMYLFLGLKDQSVDRLALFVGNGADLVRQVENGEPDDDDIVEDMLWDVYCEFRDLPCDRPNGKDYNDAGPMQGLQGLDMWWRKARTNDEHGQDERFRFAVYHGFTSTRADFNSAYNFDFGLFSEAFQNRAIYSFIAALYNLTKILFGLYVGTYGPGSITDQQKRYETAVNDHILDVKEGLFSGKFIDYFKSGRRR